MKNYDTASTLIGLIPGSALMICLGGWLGAGGVAIFVIYAWFPHRLNRHPCWVRRSMRGKPDAVSSCLSSSCFCWHVCADAENYSGG
jgi:hypothetical protein